MDYKYILVPLIFIIFDCVTGTLQAFINGVFESKRMRIGGFHKLVLLVVLAFGIALDYSQKLIDLGFNVPCLKIIAAYITLMEIMSIVENINASFPNALPKFLVNTLKQAAKDNGVEEE